MKTKLLLLSILFYGGVFAQNLTLTQAANEPSVGDVSNTYALDTTFYSSGLPSNISGDGVTWDFSNLTVTPPLLTSNYVSPSSLTVTAPSGCTFVEDQSGSYTFFKSVTSPTTQTELLSLNVGTLALNFSNSAIVARYPINYGYALTDVVSGSVTFSLPATFSGNSNSSADGQGTLIMPQGHTYTNILRIKSVQTITVSVLTFSIAQINQTIYNYYHSSHKFPILTITNSANTFSSQTTQITSATGNAAFLAIGIKENTLNTVNFDVYPNPANNTAHVLLANNKIAESVTVINSIGQKIKTYSNTNQLNISELHPGIYYLEVKSDEYYGRKPLVISK